MAKSNNLDSLLNVIGIGHGGAWAAPLVKSTNEPVPCPRSPPPAKSSVDPVIPVKNRLQISASRMNAKAPEFIPGSGLYRPEHK